VHEGIQYGFFTNDAGTGSAAIAHCASQEQHSGKVAIMSMIEPFISTCVMCTLTALAIVTTDSFQKKYSHAFDRVDIQVVEGDYREGTEYNKKLLHDHMTGAHLLGTFDGQIKVVEGEMENRGEFTLLHNRSVAEDVKVTQGGKPFTGSIQVCQGGILRLEEGVVIQGKSLVRDAELALCTFQENPWMDITTFLMILCFLLFAFSTVISFCYFGGQALVYLGGERYLLFYQIFFLFCSFLGGVVEATIIWKIAVISCAMMGIPTLVGILLMRKDIKESVEDA